MFHRHAPQPGVRVRSDVAAGQVLIADATKESLDRGEFDWSRHRGNVCLFRRLWECEGQSPVPAPR